MTRTRVQMNLPEAFARHYGPNIDLWLEGAKPGETLCIYTGRHPTALNAFVADSYVERHTIEVRARLGDTLLLSCPPIATLIIEPADQISREAVEREEGFLQQQAALQRRAAQFAAEDMVAGTGIVILCPVTERNVRIAA